MSRSRLSVIIHAAGPRPRVGGKVPLPLIDLDGTTTVLEAQLAAVRAAFPGAEVVVALGDQADRVLRAFPRNTFRAVENERAAETGPLRSIGLALRVVSFERVLVLPGDLLFDAAAIATLPTRGAAVLVDATGQFRDAEVGVTLEGRDVAHFDYDLPLKWAQVAYLAGGELDGFRALAWHPRWKGRLVFEALNEVLSQGGRLRAVERAGCRYVEIDTPADVERARRLALGRAAS